MTEENANPEAGAITDMTSAVESMIAQEEPATETDETEAPQEAQDTVDEDAEPEEAEAPEDADDDAEEEPGEPVDRQYTVKVNGETYEVNETELLAGYQKGADYQNKTTELAEERRTLQTQTQQAEQLRGQLEAALAKYAQADEQEPDWVKLATELDPWEYQQRQATWQVSLADKGRAHQASQHLAAQRHVQIIRENGGEIVKHFPDWVGNTPKFEADREEMRKAAVHYGFTDQEFMSATDYRSFVLLRDAMRGRKLAGTKPDLAKKVPRKATKVLKPGAAETPATRKAKGKSALQANLRKRGDVDAAVEFILGGN